MKEPSMVVAGVMSGTSADGVNVALVRISSNVNSATQSQEISAALGRPLRIELLAHAAYPYSRQVRNAVLTAMNSPSARVADLARLNFLLGDLYAAAILSTQSQFKIKADLIGCHGQTLYHQSEPSNFLGHQPAATWQTGEAAIIAEKLGVPVVSDFRPADIAAGGKGAPLVPFLDYMLFRDEHNGRIVQNIGGIANLTVIPAGATAADVIAFDTGPGNMVIDTVTEKLFNRPYDRNGKIAASGTVLEKVVNQFLRLPYFRQQPPKTAGREEFGREFVSKFLRLCKGCRKQDTVATATALTVKSIVYAVRQLADGKSKRQGSNFQEMILSGGGAGNSTLVNMLKHELAALGIRLRLSDEFGLPSSAKEAVAFAVLAYQTWHRRPSNLPAATGAKHPAVLGKISYP
jgi:anhydro-N-acetylmuramic acid kinase